MPENSRSIASSIVNTSGTRPPSRRRRKSVGFGAIIRTTGDRSQWAITARQRAQKYGTVPWERPYVTWRGLPGRFTRRMSTDKCVLYMPAYLHLHSDAVAVPLEAIFHGESRRDRGVRRWLKLDVYRVMESACLGLVYIRKTRHKFVKKRYTFF